MRRDLVLDEAAPTFLHALNAATGDYAAAFLEMPRCFSIVAMRSKA
jgi:hypothetical protein